MPLMYLMLIEEPLNLVDWFWTWLMEEPLRKFCAFLEMRKEKGCGAIKNQYRSEMHLWNNYEDDSLVFFNVKSKFYLFRVRPEMHLWKIEAFLYFHVVP